MIGVNVACTKIERRGLICTTCSAIPKGRRSRSSFFRHESAPVCASDMMVKAVLWPERSKAHVPLHVANQRLFRQTQVYKLQHRMYSASGTVRSKNDERINKRKMRAYIYFWFVEYQETLPS